MRKNVLFIIVLSFLVPAIFSGCGDKMHKYDIQIQRVRTDIPSGTLLNKVDPSNTVDSALPAQVSEQPLQQPATQPSGSPLNKPHEGSEPPVDHKERGRDRAPSRVPIITYHSVNDKPIGMKQLSVGKQDFETQIRYLFEHGYTAITFQELKNFKTYRKPVVITFDDGYEDNYHIAYPILKKYRCRATIFLIANKIDKPGYLTKQEIHEMKDVVSFQSHTVSHPDLRKTGKNKLKQELTAAKEIITAVTHEPVFVLSYPAGAYNNNVIHAASGLYDYAVSTKCGYYKEDSERMKLMRLRILRSFTISDFINAVRQ